MNDTFNHQQQLKCVAWNQNSVSDANICMLKKKIHHLVVKVL